MRPIRKYYGCLSKTTHSWDHPSGGIRHCQSVRGSVFGLVVHVSVGSTSLRQKVPSIKTVFHDYLIQNVLRLKVISVGWIINNIRRLFGLSLCSLHPLPANPLSYRQWLIQPTTIICTTPVEEKSNRESCAPKLSARTAGKQRKCFTIHYVWF